MTFVSFSLLGVHYALDILHVEEVVPLPEITPVAKLPSSFRGMINLRGVAVPIMDLRTRLGLNAGPDTLETDIIVIKMSDKVIGLIVDKVLSVCEIQEDQCMSRPEVSDGIDLQYIKAVAQVGTALVSIVQLERILGGDEKDDVFKLNLQVSEA